MKDITRAIVGALSEDGSAIAFHQDADGILAAYFACRLLPASGIPRLIPVETENFDLADLSAYLSGTSNLLMLDINISSVESGVATLAHSLTGSLIVIDDHDQRPTDLPSASILIDPRSLPTGQDRELFPPSLFLFSLLREQGITTASDTYLAAVAAFGEGVFDRFRDWFLTVDRTVLDSARSLGWSINGYSRSSPSSDSIRDVIATLLTRTADLLLPLAVEAIQDSRAIKEVQAADARVSAEVNRLSDTVLRQAPIQTKSGVTAIICRVQSNYRVANLVASNSRSRIVSGVVAVEQKGEKGTWVELRRTRDLVEPNLLDVLLRMPSAWFIARGGHPMACGATVKSEATDKFSSALVDALARI